MKALLVPTCILLLFSACKKEQIVINEVPELSAPKVRSCYSNSPSDSVYYEYYTDGNQKKVTVPNGSYLVTTYAPGFATEYNYSPLGILLRSNVISLNISGLVDTLGGGFEHYVFVHEYNTDNKLVKMKYLQLPGATQYEIFFFYDNGNLVKDSMSSFGVFNSKREYEYYLDKISTLELNPNFGMAYLPTMSKNCKKRTVSTDNLGNISISEYSYEFDSMGRVSKLFLNTPSSTGTLYYSYY